MSKSHPISHEEFERDPGLYWLFIDGSKRPNPPGHARAPGAIGVVLKDPKGGPVPGGEISERIDPVEGPTTAEYAALLQGLELAQRKGVEYIAVFSDSRNLVNQINQLWKHSTTHLEKLCAKAQGALAQFRGFQVSWIPREWNSRADELAGTALRGHD